MRTSTPTPLSCSRPLPKPCAKAIGPRRPARHHGRGNLDHASGALSLTFIACRALARAERRAGRQDLCQLVVSIKELRRRNIERAANRHSRHRTRDIVSDQRQ